MEKKLSSFKSIRTMIDLGIGIVIIVMTAVISFQYIQIKGYKKANACLVKTHIVNLKKIEFLSKAHDPIFLKKLDLLTNLYEKTVSE